MFICVYLVLYSIGAMNDYVDEPLDRLAARREKPLVARDDFVGALRWLIWVADRTTGFCRLIPVQWLALPPSP